MENNRIIVLTVFNRTPTHLINVGLTFQRRVNVLFSISLKMGRSYYHITTYHTVHAKVFFVCKLIICWCCVGRDVRMICMLSFIVRNNFFFISSPFSGKTKINNWKWQYPFISRFFLFTKAWCALRYENVIVVVVAFSLSKFCIHGLFVSVIIWPLLNRILNICCDDEFKKKKNKKLECTQRV